MFARRKNNAQTLPPSLSAEAPWPEDMCVRLEAVGKSFGSVQALKNLCAHVPAGAITGLVGPDAAGKTTLMRLMAGLMAPETGRVLLWGAHAVAPGGGSVPGVGYMPQKFGLYEDLSVFDNLSLHAELRSLYGEERRASFEKLLSFTALEPFQARLAGKLSGGMKQKLGLACALLGTPRLLLLDEPGVGVDPESRRELWRMVVELAGNGMTVIWSTAYIEEAERCPHVLVLSEGRLLYEGSPAEFTSRVQGRVYFTQSPPEGYIPRQQIVPQGECILGPPPDSGIRNALLAWAGQKDVVDALAQGSRVRLVLAKDAPAQAGLKPAVPRLEDAYMDAMGGISKRPSPFLEYPLVADTFCPEPVIVAKGLTKTFGTFTAAKNISFSVAAGRIFGLLGPNGAGKSTTFRMLCGLSRPTHGDCMVAGVNLLSSGSQARAQLGYMAQKFSLYEDITVKQNMRLCAELYGLPKGYLEKQGLALAQALEMDMHLNTQARQLPLGQKQRLALLCAILHSPKALFLDEPTSGVDPRTRREFWKHINALTRLGVAVLVTTHFMEEAEYCDEIALIYHGQMIAHGSPDELKKTAPHPENPDPTMEDAFIAWIKNYHEDYSHEQHA